jgi:hypothetical protein
MSDVLFILQELKKRHLELNHFHYIKYTPGVGLENRLAIASDSSSSVDILIDEMLKHSNQNHASIPIKLENIQSVLSLFSGKSEAIGLVSPINEMGDKAKHIPMLDFKCEVSDRNSKIIETFLKKINQPGYLLNSGNSYHFYGKQLMNKEEWLKLNYQALLMVPYVDQRYIAHRLLSGFSVLRINKTENKPTVPFLITEF